MKLHVIDTGLFKLDGGAMYGVVPKTLWSKYQEADEQNRVTWAMRCLLIEKDDKLILMKVKYHKEIATDTNRYWSWRQARRKVF